MIGALDAIALDDLAERERRETVRTRVLERHDPAVLRPVKHDRLAENAARPEFAFFEVG